MNYDLAIIGAGWAGLNAAIKAKASGLKVILVEKNQIGGTCLNRGCIPTKTLIQSARIYSLIKKSKIFGVETTDLKIIFSEIQKRKDKIIEQLRQGINFMLKNIEILHGDARFKTLDTLCVNGEEVRAKYILIASGSIPVELDTLKFDTKKIISSDEILDLKEVPKSLLIIGGGVIGCEFASLFSVLGSSVYIIEKMPQILPGIDKEIAKKLELVFRKKGIVVKTNTDASNLDLNDYDLILLCVGRIPYLEDLDLDKAGVQLENGKIIVDEYLKTNIPSIYAAGDCTAKIMLAHYASYQGIIAAENIANPHSFKKADNSTIPNCIFTDPEIATVGLTEEEAINQGLDIKINRFDFLGSAMARILDETEGFIKIISDNRTGLVLGASIIGPKATELIAILTTVVSCGLGISEFKNIIFAHPTLSESISEAIK